MKEAGASTAQDEESLDWREPNVTALLGFR
jgi:hypothetical protein